MILAVADRIIAYPNTQRRGKFAVPVKPERATVQLIGTRAGHGNKLSGAVAVLRRGSITDKTNNNLIKIDSLTNAVQVKAAANMTLEATGSMTIKGATISIEASGTFALKANGMGTVQASGPLAVKGAVVQIN